MFPPMASRNACPYMPEHLQLHDCLETLSLGGTNEELRQQALRPMNDAG